MYPLKQIGAGLGDEVPTYTPSLRAVSVDICSPTYGTFAYLTYHCTEEDKTLLSTIEISIGRREGFSCPTKRRP